MLVRQMCEGEHPFREILSSVRHLTSHADSHSESVDQLPTAFFFFFFFYWSDLKFCVIDIDPFFFTPHFMSSQFLSCLEDCICHNSFVESNRNGLWLTNVNKRRFIG